MPRFRWLAGLLLLGLLAIPDASGADVPIPPVARVTDLTGTLSTEQQHTLSGRLADFEQEKGSQLAVLVVPSTKPETIEQYGIRVGEAWKLGRKGVDDGVILIVAKDDHRLRIEVGYGLEGAIPDAVARRIIDEAITPSFKAGDFYAGINAGVDRIMRAARSEGAGSSPPQDGAASDDAAAEQAAREQLEQQRAEFDEAQKQLDAMQKDQNHTINLIMGFFAFLMVSILGIAVAVGVRKGKRSGGRGSSGSGSDSSSSSSSSGSGSSDDSFSGDGGGFGGGGASGSW